MSMHFEKKLPIPAEIKHQNPLSDSVKRIKKERDRELREIFTGKSDRFVLIIGPCSSDNEEAVLDYLGRLAQVQVGHTQGTVGDAVHVGIDGFLGLLEDRGERQRGLSDGPSLRQGDTSVGQLRLSRLKAGPELLYLATLG